MEKLAVEWLVENLQVILPKNQFNDVVIQDMISQAKEKQKEQTLKFAYDFHYTKKDVFGSDEYYDKFFNNQK